MHPAKVVSDTPVRADHVARRRSGGVSPAVAIAAVACALSFFGGGYDRTAWVWSTVIFLWLSAAILVVREPAIEITALGAAVVVLMILLNIWTLASVVWSRDRVTSALEAERTLVYVSAL